MYSQTDSPFQEGRIRLAGKTFGRLPKAVAGHVVEPLLFGRRRIVERQIILAEQLYKKCTALRNPFDTVEMLLFADDRLGRHARRYLLRVAADFVDGFGAILVEYRQQLLTPLIGGQALCL